MNPEDRSVDEIDAAMDRRWGKISVNPNPQKVRDFLVGNGIAPPMVGPIVQFFVRVQDHFPLGHAFFRKVRDPESLERLWDSQIHYAARKRFRFDADALLAVEGLWADCRDALALPNPESGAAAGTDGESDAGAT